MTTAIAAPPVRSEDQRRTRLRVMKRRATLLFVFVTAVFLTATLARIDAGWVGYVQATAEAAMVGALADWFAVTALFRHPLGLPIPHTAIVVERKDQFAATLGEFVQETFLTPEAIVGKLRSANVVPRLAEWLRQPANASRASAEILDGAVQLADLVRDEDVNRVIERALRERLDAVPLAPLGGRALEVLIRDGRHQQVLDVGLRELDRYLVEHREDLRDRLGDRSPWWLPGAAEDRIFERLIDGAQAVIADMLNDGGHHLRRNLEERLVVLAHDLQTSPDYREKGERLKNDILERPEVRAWAASIWQEAKAQLRSQAVDPDSDLRQRVTGLILATGSRLQDDPELAAKLEEGIEKGVSYLVERFHGEIEDLVTGTIARWDAEETADRLELLLGPDLQFIRINGTVVGGLAGLALHAVAQVLG